MSAPTLRDNSRARWTGSGTIEAINAGSLQRIADAVEALTNKLGADFDSLKRRAESAETGKTSYASYARRLDHKLRGTRGALTRLKRKNAAERLAGGEASP